MKTYKDDHGTILWYNEQGQFHREDGPAVECVDGYKAWYRNDQYHREDGPAIECADGSKFWYLNDVEYTEQEFLEKTQGVVELTVAEIEKLVGKKVKIVKE